VQQELIAEIHQTSLWPIVVTVDGNIRIPANSNFVDRDGSYIILIPNGNIKTFMDEINGLVQTNFRFTRLWNYETRFVVAGANEFSISQQRNIFEYFSNFRIYNCIIVTQEYYALDKEFRGKNWVNIVETGKKLVVYTWFPYQSSDHCTEVNAVTLLDSWVITAQGQFTKNTDLFPRKINNNLNRCPMKAFIRDTNTTYNAIYVQRTFSNGSSLEYMEGFEYQLLNVVLQKMNMRLVHDFTPNVSYLNVETTIKLIVAMVAKEIYIAVGGIGTDVLSVSYFDSTNPYYMMRMRWYVPCSVKYPRWSSIFRILSVELWLVLIITIVIAAVSTTLVGRYSCTLEWKRYKSLSSSLTNIWAVILGVSVSTMPRTPSLRSLFLGWVCFSVAFSTVFQSFLTSFLIDSGYKTPIQNMDELFASGMKLAYRPEYSYIFEQGDETELTKVQRNLANCPSYDVCLDWAKYQKNVSILMIDTNAEDYYSNGFFVGDNSEHLMCGLEDGVVYFTGLHMVMFYGDPLMRRVNEIIARFFEAGLYDFWITINSEKGKLLAWKKANFLPPKAYYSFNLYHMQPAFYIFFIGCFLSAHCFIIELLYNCVLNKRY